MRDSARGHWQDIAEKARLRAERAEAGVAELRRQLRTATTERDELRARVAELAPPDRVTPILRDPDRLEVERYHAWSEQPHARDYWDADEGEYFFPDGWPEGVVPARYVADRLKAEGTPTANGDAGAPSSGDAVRQLLAEHGMPLPSDRP